MHDICACDAVSLKSIQCKEYQELYRHEHLSNMQHKCSTKNARFVNPHNI